MWEYLFISGQNKYWVECILLHEFIDKYQIKYYDISIKNWVEKLVSYELIRKKEK